MSQIYQGTTPTIQINLNEDYPEHFVQDVEEITVQLVQGVSCLTKTLEDLELDAENNCFLLELSEDETNLFSGTVVNMQIRYKMIDSNKVYGAPIIPIRIIPSLVSDDSKSLEEGFNQEEYLWRIMKM